jgi:hypothetical protein
VRVLRYSVVLTLSASSQAVLVWATGGLEALLVSLFNVKWGFSVPAGCLEGSILPLLGGFACKVGLQCLSKISL